MSSKKSCWLAAFAFWGLLGQAHSGVFIANFDSGVLDASLTHNSSSQWAMTSGEGFLRFTSPGFTGPRNFTGVTYAPLMTGDFVATVNVDLSHTDNMNAGLRFVGATSTDFSTNITAYRRLASLASNIGGYDPNTQAFPPNVFGLGATQLTLQLARVGDIFSESYQVGSGSFVEFHTFSAAAWSGEGGYLSLQAYQNVPQVSPADIRFSSFSVSTPVPLPASFGLVLLGLIPVCVRNKFVSRRTNLSYGSSRA